MGIIQGGLNSLRFQGCGESRGCVCEAGWASRLVLIWWVMAVRAGPCFRGLGTGLGDWVAGDRVGNTEARLWWEHREWNRGLWGQGLGMRGLTPS